MKFGAVYCTYEDDEYLEVSVKSVEPYMDKVLFLISDVPWNGTKIDNSKTIEKVKALCKTNDKFELIQGHWENEIKQRNFGLSRFFNWGIDYCLVIDADEVYHPLSIKNLIAFTKQNPEYDAIHCKWDTYWKESLYKIYPREDYAPLVLVKVQHFLFTIIRDGISSVNRTKEAIFKSGYSKEKSLILPENVSFVYHLSYARSDEYIKRKFETNSHANEFVKDWYENVWLKWTPKMENLHPITPEQYKKAIKEDFSVFPNILKAHFKKKMLKDRKCSIIILNWNSSDLLERCLQLIQQNTKRKNIEVIVVDNGSEDVSFVNSLDNDSYGFKIKKKLNEKNLGFAAGVNVGINLADKTSDICLLNVDAEVQENWLTEMYKTMIKFGNAGMVGPLGNVVDSGFQRVGYVNEDSLVPNLHGFCILIIRELINKIGYFDEYYKIGGYEDNDYCIRSKLAGYQTYIAHKSLVIHKAHQVFKKNNLDSSKVVEANREMYLDKFFSVLLDYSQVTDLFSYEDLSRKTGIKI